jgi:hypothetical protein
VTHQPSIFVSYAHEDALLAQGLAMSMQERGARVWIDQGELLVGDSLIDLISEAIAEFDFVAALVSAASVQSNWCRKEIAMAMTKQLVRGARPVTVLPVRVGDVEMPPSLRDVKWIPLDAKHVADCAIRLVTDASRHLARIGSLASAPESSPKSAPRPVPRPWSEQSAAMPDNEPIRIVGVDTEGVGEPRMDESRGSALYRVPLLLNRVPETFWASQFVETWNRPPTSSLMHRPGIASIQGDRIILDGTTIDELERYHLATLKLVVKVLNEQTADHRGAERARRDAEAAAREAHLNQIRETTERLKFDD